MSKKKLEAIKNLKDAIRRSKNRLKILNAINKRETIHQIGIKLGIKPPNMSPAISALETYELIKFVKNQNGSKIYEKAPMVNQLGNLEKWLDFEIEEEKEEKPKKRNFKAKTKTPPSVPFLTAEIEDDAIKMAYPFRMLYLLENSIRNFIDGFYQKNMDKNGGIKLI